MVYLQSVSGSEDGLDKPTKKKILKKAGYSDSVAKKPSRVFDSKGWEEMMDLIDNRPYLAKLDEIAKSDDKRSALQAIDRLFEIQGLKKGDGININITKEREEVFGA